MDSILSTLNGIPHFHRGEKQNVYAAMASRCMGVIPPS
jgi:hypothetical protein